MKTNHIVSGLERSGTSLMMQILEESNVPVSYDNSRLPDEHNPKGYYELHSGKIIKEIESLSFDFDRYSNSYIKVTCFGLLNLPKNRKYKVIYMVRNIDEVVESSKRMMSEIARKKLGNKIKTPLAKLNNHVLEYMDSDDRFTYTIINYNNLINNPEEELKKLKEFENRIDIEKSIRVINPELYRCRKDSRDNEDKKYQLTDKEKEVIKGRLKELGYL